MIHKFSRKLSSAIDRFPSHSVFDFDLSAKCQIMFIALSASVHPPLHSLPYLIIAGDGSCENLLIKVKIKVIIQNFLEVMRAAYTIYQMCAVDKHVNLEPNILK